MSLELELWDNPLQDLSFKERTNKNWLKIMEYANGQGDANAALYAYIDQVITAESFYRSQGDETLANRMQSEFNALKMRIDSIILNSGSSDAEVSDARVDVDGFLYSVLKERLDSEQQKAESKSTLFFEKNGLQLMKKQDLTFYPIRLENDEIEEWLILDEQKSILKMEEITLATEVKGLPGSLVLANFGLGKRFSVSTKAFIYPNVYQIGGAYITGNVEGSPPYWSYSIDGKMTPGGATGDDNTFKIYVPGKITTTSQSVVVYAFEDSARTLEMGKAIVQVVS